MCFSDILCNLRSLHNFSTDFLCILNIESLRIDLHDSTIPRRLWSTDNCDIQHGTKWHHRLNGSSSPELTATCLSYGSLCDFLTFFPEPTWRSHPPTNFDTNDKVDLRKDIFVPPAGPAPRPPKMSKFIKILDFENFRSILPLTLRISGANTPYSSSEPNESAIENR